MDWHYQDPRTGERRGPTSHDVLADKLARGEVTAETLVWRVGFSQWTAVAQTAEFGRAGKAIAAPPSMPTAMPSAESVAVAMPADASIGYFSPRGETPARVRENLSKYAPSTGPVGDWPLNDEHVAQLSQAVFERKRILASYGLIRLVAALQTLAAVVMLIVGVVSLFSGGRTASQMGWPMLIPGVVFAAFAALAFACASATWYCRAWGSLVMAILTTIGCAMQVASAFLTAAAVGSAPGGVMGMMLFSNLFVVLICGAFAFVYWRGWAATSRYLNTPVWCQEALAVADRVR